MTYVATTEVRTIAFEFQVPCLGIGRVSTTRAMEGIAKIFEGVHDLDPKIGSILG